MSRFRRKRTLKKSIISVVMISVIPIVISMFILSIISLQNIRKQIFSTNYDMLSLHMNQIDQELEAMEKFLLNVDNDQIYINDFESNDSDKIFFASNHYLNDISPMIYFFEYVEGIMIYSPKSEASVYHYNSASNIISYNKREQIMSVIKRDYASMPKNKWTDYKVQKDHVLIYVYQVHDTYFCSWILVDNLMKIANEWQISNNGIIYFVDAERNVMSQSKVDKKAIDLTGNLTDYYISGDYLILGIDSKEGRFSLMESVNVKELTDTYQNNFLVVLFVVVVFFLLLIYITRRLNRTIFIPMMKIQNAIREIENGRLDYQIEQLHDTEEFEHLIVAFNDMVKQIEHLKIETYEDKIEQHKIMLQYLQVQIEPHFYLNALNTISAMAQVGDTKLILDLTKFLSEYMRFITKSKNGTVTVSEEINHIMNYIEIIKIRLGNNVKLVLDIDEKSRSIHIPPLIIQNLVENVIKYALDVYEDNNIVIHCKYESNDDKKYLCIEVEDDGAGYPLEVIESFYSKDFESSRIGLVNTKKRLFYMYGNRAEFTISNKQTGGAMAQIFIKF